MILAVAGAPERPAEEGEMAEPGNGAVQGVVYALKGLRTRTGLSEERLRGTELALDVLYDLDSVRELIDGGERRDRAVVRAVRAAARTLEPTMSFVADASLSLELYADQVTDVGLYAEDLGQRRKALLQNWRRLHELRSVSPGKAPSPRALRMEVETEALTALAVALAVGADTDDPSGAPVGAKKLRTREPQPGEITAGRRQRLCSRRFRTSRRHYGRTSSGTPTASP